MEFADHTDSSGAEATERALRDDPGVTAIVYTTDLLAVAGMARAREIGRPVPQTLSITGFDDSPLAAPAGLTSAWVDYQQLGRGAAEHLMALIRGEPPPAFSPVRSS